MNNIYKLNELSHGGDMTENITSLVREHGCIEIKGIGLVDSSNVSLVCKTIKATLNMKKSSARKSYKKRTHEFDMLVLEYSKKHTIRATGELFNIPHTTVQYIKKKYGVC